MSPENEVISASRDTLTKRVLAAIVENGPSGTNIQDLAEAFRTYATTLGPSIHHLMLAKCVMGRGVNSVLPLPDASIEKYEAWAKIFIAEATDPYVVTAEDLIVLNLARAYKAAQVAYDSNGNDTTLKAMEDAQEALLRAVSRLDA